MNINFNKKGGKLDNIPFAIKDNIAIENTITTSGTKLLRQFKPNYSSTVYKKLINEGAIPLFKSNLDELAMGGTGLTSGYKKVVNPFNPKVIIGGSSSGSNYLVADGTVPFAIGTDTGDSVRKPSCYTGIVGFKPSWGLVSRYGVYDFATTLDSVGWFTKTTKEAALLLDVLQGVDENDFSTIKSNEKDYLKDIDLKEKYKIGIIPELEKYIKDKKIREDYLKVINLLKKENHEIIEFKPNMKLLESILIVYQIISSIESFSTNSNLTGFLFGSDFKKGVEYNDGITEARTKNFSYEVKKRFLFGQKTLQNKNSYEKALKLRTLINKEINNILEKVDVLIAPATSTFSPKISDLGQNQYKNILDNFLILFNFNGSPSLSLPITFNKNKSTSINISSSPFNDKKIFKMSNYIEELINEK